MFEPPSPVPSPVSPDLRADAAALPQQRLRSRAPVVIAFVALVLIAAVLALAWERVSFTQRQALEAETSKNDNLAIAHAETMTREIELVDQLLRLLRDDLRQRPLPRDIGPRVAAAGLAATHVLVVSYVDANGYLAASTLPYTAPPTANFRDRDYFNRHAAEAEDRPIVSVPVLGRLTGQWVISVTRRVEKTGGGFGGVLYAAVDPAVFARLYERSALGESCSLALIGLDGVTRVRRNGDKVSFGGDVRRSQCSRS